MKEEHPDWKDIAKEEPDDFKPQMDDDEFEHNWSLQPGLATRSSYFCFLFVKTSACLGANYLMTPRTPEIREDAVRCVGQGLGLGKKQTQSLIVCL